jgi:septal ring-binding cell division protein DamX
METPPPDETVPAGPPERRCPRCGSTLAPDQEWCLACGAAADTEIVEARGWRVPLYLGGGLAALAVIGVVLAILALANQKEEQPGQAANPSPSAVAPLPTQPAPTPTTPPLETSTPGATETVTPAPTETAPPDATPTQDPGTTSTFPGWSGQDGDYTVILKSSSSQSSAESFAQEAQDAGHTVGVLNSDDFSSLNSGYWVVFSGTYATEDEAETALDDLKSDYSDAYIRQIST